MNYCSQADLENYLSLDTQSSYGISTTIRDTVISQVSERINGYLQSAGYVLPITSVGNDIKSFCAKIVAFELAQSKISDKDLQVVQSFQYLNESSIRYFEQVASGKIKPQGIVDSSANTNTNINPAFVCLSDTSGWS